MAESSQNTSRILGNQSKMRSLYEQLNSNAPDVDWGSEDDFLEGMSDAGNREWLHKTLSDRGMFSENYSLDDFNKKLGFGVINLDPDSETGTGPVKDQSKEQSRQYDQSKVQPQQYETAGAGQDQQTKADNSQLPRVPQYPMTGVPEQQMPMYDGYQPQQQMKYQQPEVDQPIQAPAPLTEEAGAERGAQIRANMEEKAKHNQAMYDINKAYGINKDLKAMDDQYQQQVEVLKQEEGTQMAQDEALRHMQMQQLRQNQAAASYVYELSKDKNKVMLPYTGNSGVSSDGDLTKYMNLSDDDVASYARIAYGITGKMDPDMLAGKRAELQSMMAGKVLDDIVKNRSNILSNDKMAFFSQKFKSSFIPEQLYSAAINWFGSEGGKMWQNIENEALANAEHKYDNSTWGGLVTYGAAGAALAYNMMMLGKVMNAGFAGSLGRFSQYGPQAASGLWAPGQAGLRYAVWDSMVNNAYWNGALRGSAALANQYVGFGRLGAINTGIAMLNDPNLINRYGNLTSVSGWLGELGCDAKKLIDAYEEEGYTGAKFGLVNMVTSGIATKVKSGIFDKAYKEGKGVYEASAIANHSKRSKAANTLGTIAEHQFFSFQDIDRINEENRNNPDGQIGICDVDKWSSVMLKQVGFLGALKAVNLSHGHHKDQYQMMEEQGRKRAELSQEMLDHTKMAKWMLERTNLTLNANDLDDLAAAGLGRHTEFSFDLLNNLMRRAEGTNMTVYEKLMRERSLPTTTLYKLKVAMEHQISVMGYTCDNNGQIVASFSPIDFVTSSVMEPSPRKGGGWRVASIGKNSEVVEYKTFKSKDDAEYYAGEVNKLAKMNNMRLLETELGDTQTTVKDVLNSYADRNGIGRWDAVELYNEWLNNRNNASPLAKEMASEVKDEIWQAVSKNRLQAIAKARQQVNDMTGVDVSTLLSKDPSKLSKEEQDAIDTYNKMLWEIKKTATTDPDILAVENSVDPDTGMVRSGVTRDGRQVTVKGSGDAVVVTEKANPAEGKPAGKPEMVPAKDVQVTSETPADELIEQINTKKAAEAQAEQQEQQPMTVAEAPAPEPVKAGEAVAEPVDGGTRSNPEEEIRKVKVFDANTGNEYDGEDVGEGMQPGMRRVRLSDGKMMDAPIQDLEYMAEEQKAVEHHDGEVTVAKGERFDDGHNTPYDVYEFGSYRKTKSGEIKSVNLGGMEIRKEDFVLDDSTEEWIENLEDSERITIIKLFVTDDGRLFAEYKNGPDILRTPVIPNGPSRLGEVASGKYDPEAINNANKSAREAAKAGNAKPGSAPVPSGPVSESGVKLDAKTGMPTVENAPEQTAAYFAKNESKLGEKMNDAVIKQVTDKANAAYQAAMKKTPKLGTDMNIMRMQQEQAAIEAEQAALKQQADYWNAVTEEYTKAKKQAQMKAEGEKYMASREDQIKGQALNKRIEKVVGEIGDPSTVREAVLMDFLKPGGFGLSKEDVIKELGPSIGNNLTAEGLRYQMAKGERKNLDLTIQSIAEGIASEHGWDVQDVRNEIIYVLTSFGGDKVKAVQELEQIADMTSGRKGQYTPEQAEQMHQQALADGEDLNAPIESQEVPDALKPRNEQAPFDIEEEEGEELDYEEGDEAAYDRAENIKVIQNDANVDLNEGDVLGKIYKINSHLNRAQGQAIEDAMSILYDGAKLDEGEQNMFPIAFLDPNSVAGKGLNGKDVLQSEIYQRQQERLHPIYEAYIDTMNKLISKTSDVNTKSELIALRDNAQKRMEQVDRTIDPDYDEVAEYWSKNRVFDIEEDEKEGPVFYSNASRAVEGIKQERATSEQWLNMIKNGGGLKAGEDKWTGLSTWLESRKGEKITKQEILDYINDHMIKIDEVEYRDYKGNEDGDAWNLEPELEEFADGLRKEFKGKVADGKSYSEAFDEMAKKYGEDFTKVYDKDLSSENEDLMYSYSMTVEDFYYNLTGKRIKPTFAANSIRLKYTTKGLQDKREFALVVPGIDPYNESDQIHFGDAGDGRAVAWVRFGDAYEGKDEYDLLRSLGVGDIAERPKKVLVIDEIQSKRHQDGREKGYKSFKESDIEKFRKEAEQLSEYYDQKITEIAARHGLSEEQRQDVFQLMEESEFEELGQIESKLRELDTAISESVYEGVPDAPFDKNWSELAMKRMLRYAADNGYDKIAWTTGEQQSDRYGLDKVIDGVDRFDDDYYLHSNTGYDIKFQLEDGVMKVAEDLDNLGLNGKRLEDVVGKDVAAKIEGLGHQESLQTDDLRVYNDGMRAFYDKMLPSFMNKYGKRFGIQVGKTEFPNLEDGGVTMHSVDVTPELVRSVKMGQPQFDIEKGDSKVPELEGVNAMSDKRVVERAIRNVASDNTLSAGEKAERIDAIRKRWYDIEDKRITKAAKACGVDGKFMKRLGNATGSKVVADERFFNSETENGFYDAETDTIYVNPRGNKMGNLSGILGHETTHGLEGTNGYDELSDILIEFEYGKDGDVSEAIREIQDRYNNHFQKMYELGKHKSLKHLYWEGAKKEVVANVLKNSIFKGAEGAKMLEQAVERMEDQTMAGRFCAKLRDMYDLAQTAWNEGWEKAVSKKELMDARDKFADLALKRRAENNKDLMKTRNMYDNHGNVVATVDERNDIQMNLETYGTPNGVSYDGWTDNLGFKHEGTRARMAAYMDDKIQAGLMKPEDKKQMLEKMDYWYDYMRKVADFTDPETGEFKFKAFHEWNVQQPVYRLIGKDVEEKVLSTIVKNGEYPVNLELTTDCIKRETFTQLLNEIVRLAPGALKNLNPGEITIIQDMMKSYGIQTACPLCFVEGKRLAIRNWSQTVADNWNVALAEAIAENDLLNGWKPQFKEIVETVDGKKKKRTVVANLKEMEELLGAFGFASDDAVSAESWDMVKSRNDVSEQQEFQRRVNNVFDILSGRRGGVLDADQQELEAASKEASDRMLEMERNWLMKHVDEPWEMSLEEREEIDKILSGGKALVHHKMKSYISQYPELRKVLHQEDLIGNKGLDNLRSLGDDAHKKLFSSILLNFGVGTPKVVQRAEPYAGEIMDRSMDSAVNKAVKEGGWRLFSFSDYDITKTFDIMQIFWDAEARNAKLQSYSKEVPYILFFGRNTNAKINMSTLVEVRPDADVIERYKKAPNTSSVAGKETKETIRHEVNEYAGLVLNKEGKIIGNNWEDGQTVTKNTGKEGEIIGMTWSNSHSVSPEFAQAIFHDDEYNANCGATTVGVSVNHTLYSMMTPWIRQVIPFHISGMPIAARNRTDVLWYRDFTSDQNTCVKNDKGDWVNITGQWAKDHIGNVKQFNFYEGEEKEGWDLRKRCEDYVKWCKKNKFRPKFEWALNADNYVAWCKENGYEPNQQIESEMRAHETNGIYDNYYKVIADFNPYKPTFDADGNYTGDVKAPHKPIKGDFTKDQGLLDLMFGAEDSMLANREANIAHGNAMITKMANDAISFLQGKKTREEIMSKDPDAFRNTEDADLYLRRRREQWDIEEAEPAGPIRSRNFKRWFGNWDSDPENSSKVVDEKGRPLVCYHSTEAEDIQEFDPKKIKGGSMAMMGLGFNFTTGYQTGYGSNVIRVYLNARHPMMSNKKTITWAKVKSLLKEIDNGETDTIAAEYAGMYAPFGSREYDMALNKAARSIYDYAEGDMDIYSAFSQTAANHEKVMNAFRKLGFDSAFEYDREGKLRSVVVLDPEQIKSADGNNGDYDPGKRDIYYDVEEETGNQQPIEAAGNQVVNVTESSNKKIFSTKEEVDKIIATFKEEAEKPNNIDFTKENFEKEFPNNQVKTPVGTIRIGKNQFEKLQNNGRSKQLGMMASTLKNPDFVLFEEDIRKDVERNGLLLFMKTFLKEDGSKHVHYESVTVKIDDMETNISNHIINESALRRKLISSEMLYNRKAPSSNSSELRLAEILKGSPDLVPTRPNSAFYDGKGSEKSLNKQGNVENSSVIDEKTVENADFSNSRKQFDIEPEDMSDRNAAYRQAVESGDREKALEILQEEADKKLNRELLLPNDDDEKGFKYHRGPAPKKTFKRYAVLNVTPDGFKAAYAGNKTGTPVGTWIDAQNLQSYMSDMVQFDDGSFASYIPGDTGASTKSKFSNERQEELGLKGGQRWLLERGGKHSSDVPNFSQMNLKQNEAGEKVSSSKDGALPHNKLIFEIEYGIDENGDLTDYVKENGRMIKGKNQGLAKIEPNQYYDFKTNPNAVGNWGIGGTFRITRLVPHEEIVSKTEQYKRDAVTEANRLYAAGKITKKDRDARVKNANSIKVQQWVGGYHPEDFGLSEESVAKMSEEGRRMKMVDITYDDNGDLIPLNERFDLGKMDARYDIEEEEEQPKTVAVADPVESKNFKRWFGKWDEDPENSSKVVDENGRPKVVHHGTDEYGFTVFNTSADWNQDNIGSHFGSEGVSKEFADKDKTYNVYLNIRKPWRTFDFFADMYDNAYLDALNDLCGDIFKQDPAIADKARKRMKEVVMEAYPNMKEEKYDSATVNGFFNEFEDDMGLFADRSIGSEKKNAESRKKLVGLMRELLEMGGYDGIKYQNWYEGENGDDTTCWIALKPEQIKSADTEGEMANNGEYDPTNQDIRYDVEPEEPKKAAEGAGTAGEAAGTVAGQNVNYSAENADQNMNYSAENGQNMNYSAGNADQNMNYSAENGAGSEPVDYVKQAEEEQWKKYRELVAGIEKEAANYQRELEWIKNGGTDKGLLTRVRYFVRNRLNLMTGTGLGPAGINNIMDQLDKVQDATEIEPILQQIQYTLNRAELKAEMDEMLKVLNTKTQSQTNSGLVKGIGVDSQTNQVLADIRGSFRQMVTTDIDAKIQEVNREIRALKNEYGIKHVEDGNEEFKTKYRELRDKYTSLVEQRAEAQKGQAQETEQDLTERNEQILNEMNDYREQGKEIPTTLIEERIALPIRQQLAQLKAMTGSLDEIEKEIQNARDAMVGMRGQERKDQKQLVLDKQKDLINWQRRCVLMSQQISNELKDLISSGKSKRAELVKQQVEEENRLIMAALEAVKDKRLEQRNQPTGTLEHENKEWTSAEKVIAHLQDSWKEQKEDTRDLIQKINSPVYSFNYLLKYLDRNHGQGDGPLYDMLMRSENGAVEANDNYAEGLTEYGNKIDKKVKDIFGFGLEELMDDSNKRTYETFTTSIQEEDGTQYNRPTEVTKGQALYIWLMSRQQAGLDKLRKDGWSTVEIKKLEKLMGEKYIKLGTWITEEFLPQLRSDRYNPTYERLYGTSMHMAAHYFPMKIWDKVIHEKGELGESFEGMPSAATGNLVMRTNNSLPIDTDVNALDMLMKYGRDMERWNAMAELTKKLNVLKHCNAFRNRIVANDGDAMWQYWLDACDVVTNNYQSKETNALGQILGKLQNSFMKNAIGFRYYTGLKQILSYPAFSAYAWDRDFQLELAANIARNFTVGKEGSMMESNYKWAMRTLPSFRQRVANSDMGIEGLNDDGIGGEIERKWSEWGMAWNKAVDARTVASGARAVYNYELRQGLKRGLSEAEAKRRAKINAEICFNESQQSSRPEFSSPLQKNRDLMSRSTVAFQNSNIGYRRGVLEGLYDILRAHNIYKDATKRIGMSQEEIRAAKAEMRKQYGRGARKITNFGALLPGLWYIGSNLSTLWANSEKDEKDDKYWINMAANIAMGLLTNGTSIGPATQAMYNTVYKFMTSEDQNSTSEYNPIQALSLLSQVVGDALKTYKEDQEAEGGIGVTGWAEGMSNWAFRFMGVNPETWANMAIGMANIINRGKPELQDAMFVLNVPGSQRKAIVDRMAREETPAEYMRQIMEAGKVYEDGDARYNRLMMGTKIINDSKRHALLQDYLDAQHPEWAEAWDQIKAFDKAVGERVKEISQQMVLEGDVKHSQLIHMEAMDDVVNSGAFDFDIDAYKRISYNLLRKEDGSLDVHEEQTAQGKKFQRQTLLTKYKRLRKECDEAAANVAQDPEELNSKVKELLDIETKILIELGK